MDVKLRKALMAVKNMPDNQIQTDAESPEVKDWSKGVRGRFFRPRKVQRTFRFDADIIAFFEKDGPGYQTRINKALRELVDSQKQHG